MPVLPERDSDEDIGRLEPGCIWFVGAGDPVTPRCADIVLFDGDLSEALVGATAAGCYRERAAADPAAAAMRLRKLAGDGWRIVRLVSGDPATSPRAIVEAGLLEQHGLRVRARCRPTIVEAAVSFAGLSPAPQDFTTGWNGLAG